MKRRLLRILSITSLVAILLFTTAGIALAVDYYFYVKVSSEAGTSDYAPLALVVDMNNQELADLGYISESGLDTRVTYGGSELKHMVAEDKLAFVAPEVKGGIDYSYSYTMGNAPLNSFSIVPGYDGYVTVSDNASMELGSNFEIEQKGWIDTSAGSDKDLVYKQNAFRTYVSAATNITAGILPSTPSEQLEQTTNDSLGNINNDFYRWAQRIDSYPAGTITQLSWYLKKNSNPTQTVYARVRKVSDDSIVGTLGALNASTLTGSLVWYDFTDVVTNDTMQDLYFTVEYGEASATNFVYVAYDAADQGAPGNAYKNTNSSVWSDQTPADMAFKLYSKFTPTTSVTATGVSSGEHTVKTNTYSKTLGSLSFDGTNDYVDVGDDTSLNITDAITIEAWVKPNGNVDAIRGIVGTKSGAGTYGFWLTTGASGKLEFWLNHSWSHVDSTTVLLDDVWYHIVATYESGSHKIYVNGTEEDSDSPTGSMTATTKPVTIGWEGQSTRYWKGLIDEVRIYDRVLSPSEVSYSYNNGEGRSIPQDQTGLVGWWHIDEGSGSVTYDETANNNDGTINEATWTDGKVGSKLAIYVDGVEEDSAALDGAPDNANDWVLMGGNSMPYMEYYKHMVGGTLIAHYQPNDMISGTTLPDREGTAQDGTITWGSLPAGITTTTGELRIINLQQISAETEESAYLELSGEVPPEWDDLYSGEQYNVLPGSEAISELAVAGQIPLKLFWVPVIFAIAIFAGFFIYSKTYNILAVAIAGGIVIGLFSAIGMLAGWVIIPYIILSVAMCVSEKTYGF